MEIANIHDAKSQLSKLVEHAMNGEEVIISKAGRPMARLVPIQADSLPRVGGQWKGRVRIAEDFDTLADDIAAAFGIDPACRFHSTHIPSSGGSMIPSSDPKPPVKPLAMARTPSTCRPPLSGKSSSSGHLENLMPRIISRQPWPPIVSSHRP